MRLTECLRAELLIPLDILFAERVLQTTREDHLACAAILMALYRQGHMALPLADLENTLRLLPANEACDLDNLALLVRSGIADFPSSPAIYIENERLYLQKNALCEQQIVYHLARLMQGVPQLQGPLGQSHAMLNSAQRAALDLVAQHPLSLLVGGPGTGKTYTAAHLVQTFLTNPAVRVVVTAPTGKAVAQLEAYLKKFLTTTTQIRSGTLHSLLGVKTDGSAQEIIPLLADLILVDECSMIDAQMFARLLASVMAGSRLILIGDPYQLPSVEAGSVFGDLVTSACIPLTELTECLRSDRQEILTLSAHIREGHAAEILHMLSLPSETVCLSELQLQGFRSPSFFDQEPDTAELMGNFDAFRFLSCMRKGPYGVDALNRNLVEKSFQQGLSYSWWTAPILITRNDHALELFNGDAGLLVRRLSTNSSLSILGEEDYALFPDRHNQGSYRNIPALALPSFEYGYCLSVHKAQGSEFDEVFVLIPPGSEVFGREVLYTAVTRARSRVTLAGSLDTIQQVIKNSARKISGLSVRLKNKGENKK